MINKNKQKGVVMIVALIMMLLITILGVSAVNIARDKTQVAGNSMFSTVVYLGAESTLARSASISSEKHIIDAVASVASGGDAIYTIPANFINDSAEVVNNTTNITSTSTITPIVGIFECPPINNEISSTVFKCRVFEVTAQTSIAATSATATHIEARAKMTINK